jgi:hypothetical protein
MNTNVASSFSCQQVIPAMKKQIRGVVNISAVIAQPAGSAPHSGRAVKAPMSASKALALGMRNNIGSTGVARHHQHADAR